MSRSALPTTTSLKARPARGIRDSTMHGCGATGSSVLIFSKLSLAAVLIIATLHYLLTPPPAAGAPPAGDVGNIRGGDGRAADGVRPAGPDCAPASRVGWTTSSLWGGGVGVLMGLGGRLVLMQCSSIPPARTDHHCQILSTSIGSENYSTFVAAVFLNTLGCLLMAGLAISAVVIFFCDRERFDGEGLESWVQAHAEVHAQKRRPFYKVCPYLPLLHILPIKFNPGSVAPHEIHIPPTPPPGFLGLTTWSYIEAKENYDYGIGPHPMRSRGRSNAGYSIIPAQYDNDDIDD
ncbi:hypothetical protein BDK51DRAFT_41410 [Blyttiomyces helicus]|uniref:Palmitoyltransferase n=1 Tax=Blyttiomyces helicus TaxID=388810 RepID=A0A4P9WC82_9FUNG|nr:hypothetical protein BDK51DRAFT_41410 [Blyttiomyces helicus]|eukprot:RKO89922.1 hypothetical protein BDK51DRAFT_41410 [Blyttiomyces helicus]